MKEHHQKNPQKINHKEHAAKLRDEGWDLWEMENFWEMWLDYEGEN